MTRIALFVLVLCAPLSAQADPSQNEIEVCVEICFAKVSTTSNGPVYDDCARHICQAACRSPGIDIVAELVRCLNRTEVP